MTRQRLLFTEPGKIEISREPSPQPQKHEVLVETRYSAISPGTEMLVYRGQWPEDVNTDSTIASLSGTFSYPLAYGYCAVGKVVEIGDAVSQSWLGQRVFGFQPHQSSFIAGVESLYPIPENLSDEAALFLPSMETAVNLLLDGRPLIGEKVVVIGQGIIGLLTTALLAKFPLSSLYALDKLAKRREYSLKLGAEKCLDPQEPTSLMELGGNSGQGGEADLVYELSGNPEALNTALSLSRYSGRVVIGSWYGAQTANLELGSFFHRGRLALISSQVSTLAPDLTGKWHTTRRLNLAWEMLHQIEVSQCITHRFALEDGATAYELVDKKPEETIQVIFDHQPTT